MKWKRWHLYSKFAMDERIPVLDLQNQQLKKQIADLESELVGARLDAKYLDKAGENISLFAL